ncbi:FHA domain-containing protein [bacterium]|nr:FHA domain-containing protein [bacterium]
MPRLTIKRGPTRLGEVALDTSKDVFQIGSDPQCDYALIDEDVFSKHLEIRKIEGKYYLSDLKGASGTLLNGVPLGDETQLIDGDQIAVGGIEFIFETTLDRAEFENAISEELNALAHELVPEPDSEPLSSATEEMESIEASAITEEVENTDSVEFYQIEEMTGEFATNAVEDEAEEKSYYLQAIYGPYIGNKYPVKKGETKIGRDNMLNDIVIRRDEKGNLDPSISRRHATVSYRDGLFYVSDKRSKTRSYVNQTKLETADEVAIHEGDEIEIVSDQKSTILRMTSSESPNLSPPKKAGIWWIRNNFRMGVWLTATLGLMTVGSFAFSFLSRQEINKQPDRLTFVEQPWLKGQKTDSERRSLVFGRERNDQRPSIALADVDGDQDVDVALNTLSGSLTVLDGESKRVLWKVDGLYPLYDIPIVLSDLNANGLQDILVVGQDTRLRALDGQTGAEIWMSPILGEGISGPPGVADLNNDGLKDLFICTLDGQVHFGYSQVNRMNWATVTTGKMIRSTPSSGDWDGDGMPEVFIGTEDGEALIVDGQLAKIEQVIDFSQKVVAAHQSDEHNIRYPIAISDLNSDGLTELIIGSTSGVYLAIDGLNQSQIWQETLPNKKSRFPQNLGPAIGDCSGDGVPDAVIASNQVIKVIRGSKDQPKARKVLWQFCINDDLFSTPVTLADFNKDGARDILIGTRKGRVYILNGLNGEVFTEIKNEWNAITSPLLVADLSGNGFLDVAYLREDQTVFVIETNSMIVENSVVWGQSHGDERHLGHYAYMGPSMRFYDLITSGSGLLFLSLALITVAARQRRFRAIHKNQMSMES